MTQNHQKQQTFPPQHQNRQPGLETEMQPPPKFESAAYKAAGKLRGKVAIITGGDSGIGRAVAVAYAKEDANIAIVYLNEHGDAEQTKQLIEKEGCQCQLFAGDVGDEAFCQKVAADVIAAWGRIDIVVNNAAEQHPQPSIVNITAEQLQRTFQTNVFALFYMIKAALPHLKTGSTIINTTSVTAYRGSPELLDYSASKGAIVAFTRSLSGSLIGQGIRVNGVAPGPIWTPLIPSTFDAQQVSTFGSDTPMKRPGQPEELAPAYVFLACEDSSYMTGQILHPNGGEIING